MESNQKPVWTAQAVGYGKIQVIIDYATRKGCLMVVDGPDDLAQQVAEKLNACEGQQLQHIEVATEHREACLQWERLMMQLVGEDGPGAVEEKIKSMKTELDFYKKLVKGISEINPATIDQRINLLGVIKRVCANAVLGEHNGPEWIDIRKIPGAIDGEARQNKLRLQAYQEQDTEIRAAINADPNESTIDEVGRILKSRYKLYLSLKELFGFCKHVLENNPTRYGGINGASERAKNEIKDFEKWRGSNEGNS